MRCMNVFRTPPAVVCFAIDSRGYLWLYCITDKGSGLMALTHDGKIAFRVGIDQPAVVFLSMVIDHRSDLLYGVHPTIDGVDVYNIRQIKWSPATHHESSDEFKAAVSTLFAIRTFDDTSMISQLPTEMMFEVVGVLFHVSIASWRM